MGHWQVYDTLLLGQNPFHFSQQVVLSIKIFDNRYKRGFDHFTMYIKMYINENINNDKRLPRP